MHAMHTDGTAAAGETIMQRQFDSFVSLMQDSDPRVRAAAAKAVCRILTDWWEAIPLATTRSLLGIVIGKVRCF